MTRISNQLLGAAVSVACLAAPASAWAQSYPTRPIEMLVGFPPGGVTDRVARVVSQYAERRLGQPVAVINKAGGGGVVGTTEAVRAAPDGYTLLMHVVAPAVLHPAVSRSLPYRYDQLTPIALTSINPAALVVGAGSSFKTLSDLAAALRAHPEKFSYATVGAAGLSTFVVAQFLEAAGVDPSKVRSIAFQGDVPSVAAVAGGHADLVAQNVAPVIGMSQAGKVRVLGVTASKRLEVLPDAPTMAEAGFASVTMMGFTGLVGPPGLPRAVVDRWDGLLREAYKDETFLASLKKAGVEPEFRDPQSFKKFLDEQYQQARKLAGNLGLIK